MAFYNSGIKRMLNGKTNAHRNTVRQLRTLEANEKADDTSRSTLAAAVNLNTAQTGITTTQANDILSNNAKVSQGLTTSGYSLSFSVNVDRDGNHKLRVSVLEDGAERAKSIELTLT